MATERVVVVVSYKPSTRPKMITDLRVKAEEEALIVEWKDDKNSRDEKLKYQVELLYLSQKYVQQVKTPREGIYYIVTFYGLPTWTNYLVRVRAVCERSSHIGVWCLYKPCFFCGKTAKPAAILRLIGSPDQYKLNFQLTYSGLHMGEEITACQLTGYTQSQNRLPIEIPPMDIKLMVIGESTEKNTQTLLLSVDIKDPNIFIAKNSIQVSLSNSVCWSDPSNEVTLSIADLEPKITLQYNKEGNRFFWENPSNFRVVQHYKFFVSCQWN